MPVIRQTANAYFQQRFGCKVYKLALDGGMTCPNRDGRLDTRGCLFCSRGGSGEFAEHCPDGDAAGQLTRAKARLSKKLSGAGTVKYIAYFQSYSNTYASPDYLRALFTPVIADPDVAALSVATRPDCLPPDVLALLAELNGVKPVFVELGLQTAHDGTAVLLRRGYPFSVYQEAAAKLQALGIPVITHLILGLPGETRAQMLETMRAVGVCCRDNPGSGVKIQLLQVLRDTDLARLYEEGAYSPLSRAAYTELVCDCVEALPPELILHRLTGDPPRALLLAPAWAADKKRNLQAVRDALQARGILLS